VLNIYTQALILNAGADSPGYATLATLFTCGGKRGLKIYSFDSNKIFTIQTHLSGKAEERGWRAQPSRVSLRRHVLYVISLFKFP
jgi:hypothetical protein